MKKDMPSTRKAGAVEMERLQRLLEIADQIQGVKIEINAELVARVDSVMEFVDVGDETDDAKQFLIAVQQIFQIGLRKCESRLKHGA